MVGKLHGAVGFNTTFVRKSTCTGSNSGTQKKGMARFYHNGPTKIGWNDVCLKLLAVKTANHSKNPSFWNLLKYSLSC